MDTQNSAKAQLDTGQGTRDKWALKGCPGTWAHGHIWAPEWCAGTYWHHNGARAYVGTRMVPGHIWVAEGYRAQMGTRMVPGHIWELEWCLGTYGHWKGAW